MDRERQTRHISCGDSLGIDISFDFRYRSRSLNGDWMIRMLRFAKVVALGAWIGAIIYFASVVTRGAFAVLLNRDQAGLLVGFTLGGLHLMGLIAALVFVMASLAIGKSLRTLIDPAVLLVILMAALTIASQGYVIPRMNLLRAQMGSVEATPPSDPRRAQFDRLHAASVEIEGGILIAGLIALFLAMREKSAQPRNEESVSAKRAVSS